MAEKIVILDGFALNPGDLDWQPLQVLGDVYIHDRTPPDLIVQRSQGATCLLVNKVALTREIMEALPDLRYVGILATGFNIVDMEAASERNIVVTNIPTYGTDSVAQHTAALMLEFAEVCASMMKLSRMGNGQITMTGVLPDNPCLNSVERHLGSLALPDRSGCGPHRRGNGHEAYCS